MDGSRAFVRGWPLAVCLCVVSCAGGCGSSAPPQKTPDAGNPDLGPIVQPIPTPTSFGGVTFPWKIFDGTVPDVPTATAPGRTFHCDPVDGNDTWDGLSMTRGAGTQGPKKTLSAALGEVKAGDTVLLKGGIYRESPSFGGVAGTATNRVTIGSYGRGTGAPIIDGGLKPAAWTAYKGGGASTVWQTSTAGLAKITSSTPVLGVYAGNGTVEMALREVPHGQLELYGGDKMPPSLDQTGIKERSRNWYFDAAGKMLYADFAEIGDPNTADVSILYNTENGPAGHELVITLQPDNSYISFIGLTIRAGSWTGIFNEAKGTTIDRCDIKFNGGSGILFGENSDNSLLFSRIWMNVLHNWPRFNNANTSGGWPGGLSWYAQSNAVAQGNVIYQNGGEGLIFWGTEGSGTTAQKTVNNHVINNIIFDNFSVNLYADNTQGLRVEQNFVFNHPLDPSQTFDDLLTLSSGYAGDWGRRMQPRNLSLADEPGSAFDEQAHLSDITVINNIIAGGPFGILDYDDGTRTVFHGLKNCKILNNTVILGSDVKSDWDSYAFRHLLFDGHPDASSNSVVKNNLFVVQSSGSSFIATGISAVGPGIDLDNNLFSGPGRWLSVETTQDFAGWKQAHSTWDQNSRAADALISAVTEFSQTAQQKPVYDWSKATPAAGSPALSGGATVAAEVTVDFAGKTRPSGSTAVGAIIR